MTSDIFEFSNDDPITPRVSNPQLSLGPDSKLQITIPQDNSLLETLNPKSYLQRENESLKKQIDQLEDSHDVDREKLREKENEIEELHEKIKNIHKKYNPKVRRLDKSDSYFPFNDYGPAWVE